jgi:PPP family 3-phenylpropionic acid transporter
VGEQSSKGFSGFSIGVTYAVALSIYGVCTPFIPLILRAKGLSDAEQGMAMGAAGLSAIAGPMLFAHIADRAMAFRRLMPILLLASSLIIGLLDYITSVAAAFGVIFLFFLFLTPAISLLDSFTLDFLVRRKNAGRPRTFQDYRIWGSIGFMLPSVVLGIWFSSAEVDPSVLLGAAVSVCFVAAIAATFLPHNSPRKDVAKLPSHAALEAAARPPLRGFFVANWVANLGLGMYYVYFPRLLQDLGCSTVDIGLIICLGVLWEVLLMPYSVRLFRKFGLERSILAGLLSIPLRMLVTVLYPTIPAMVAVQVLHAPLILGLVIGGSMYLQQHAEPSSRHSLQGLNATLTQGVARFFGPMIGAVIVGASIGGSSLDGLLRVMMLIGLLGALGAVLFYQGYRDARSVRSD